MIHRGTVKHGVVELEGGASLPDGTHVKIEPLMPSNQDAQGSEALGWPTDYFEQTFGAITDETFVRPPQGQLPGAVDFE